MCPDMRERRFELRELKLSRGKKPYADLGVQRVACNVELIAGPLRKTTIYVWLTSGILVIDLENNTYTSERGSP